MADSERPVTYEQIRGTIGSMVWLWAEIERALKRAIVSLGHEPRHGISRNLRLWSGLVGSDAPERASQVALRDRVVWHLAESLRLRNALCHGISGISAQRQDAPAFLTVQSDDRPPERLEWDRLQAMFAWMSRCDEIIVSLTEAAREADPARRAQLLAVWTGFPHRS